MTPLEFKTRVVREIPGMVLDTYGGACPWQAEGTYFGKPFYARFRSDSASMATYTDKAHSQPLMSAILDNYTGDGWNGYMEEEEALQMLKDLVNKLRPVTDDNPTSAQRLMRTVKTIMGDPDAG